MADVIGQAIHDHYFKLNPGKLWIHNDFGTHDKMPIEIYLREPDQMPELELTALRLCRGKVLDVGAGAGSHALYLQQLGVDITALEISPLAAGVMQKRGVAKVIQQNIFDLNGGKFDTLLLLMNGIGLCATITGLHQFLHHAKTLLAPGGQLLFDSSDVSYLYKKNKKPVEPYYGEIRFRYEYKKQKTPWFTWLYIDRERLQAIASKEGYTTRIIMEDDHDQYLAQLTLMH